MNKNDIKSNINWNNLIAGTAGGAVSTAVFHPLELIKVRWQVYEQASLKFKKRLISPEATNKLAPAYRPKYKSLFDTVVSVYRSENGLRGLYRGLTINTLASGSAWGLYFLIYNGLKSRHENLINNKANNTNKSTSSSNLTVANYTMDATIAGVTTIFITNPLFLVKTRMCLQYSRVDTSELNKVVKYKNSWHALVTLVKTDGPTGLYKGIVPGLFGTLNGTIQMVTYDLMKSWWQTYKRKTLNDDSYQLNTLHYSAFSSVSKIMSVCCTYPFQLVRARIQDQHQNYKNIFDVIVKTYRNERIYGFYKGLIPCLIRVTPAASVTFIVYENLLSFLNKINKQ